MTQTTDRIPLNIILIGKAGHGKSATGNSILGQTAFKRYPHLHSGTQVVTDASAQHGEYEIKVVDGPGLRVTDLDDVKNKEQMFENMATALRMCNRGVHIFVLVIKFRLRYTEEDRKAIYGLKEIFGENYLKNRGIIVMTGGYYFSGQMEADGTPGKPFKEWCREQANVLGNLIEECSPRVVLFNNLPTSEEEQTRQRNELLFYAGQLQKEHFQTHAQVRSKFIKDSKQTILEETIQKRVDMLTAVLGRLSIDSSLEDVDTLDARITGVFMEIVDEDLQQESLQQFIGSLEGLRTATEELRRAIRKKSPSAMKSNLIEECRQRNELPFHVGQLQKESTPFCRMAQTTDKITLQILLIGKAGHGKSATGISILGRKAFKTASKATAETKVLTDAWAEHGPYKIKVVDGPGLEDTDLDAVKFKEEACENMTNALMMCNGGIHAFVLVIKLGSRCTEEERKTISNLKQILGENYLKDHGIIVMTGGDYFPALMEADDMPGKTFQEWCREQSKDLGNLIEECSPRVVLFNNLSKCQEEQTRQRNELLFHAGQLQKEKGLYTSEYFQTYAQVRSKFIKYSKQTFLEEAIPRNELLFHAGQLQKEFRSTPICRMAQRTNRIPLNIILIGKTGHGKSATGNSILGLKAFQASSNTESETKFVTVAWAEHGPYEIKVVDGPGLEDTNLDAVKNKKQACGNMATALMMCNGGIHAFVLVIKFGVRYTEEERRAISDLKQIFGENYLQNHGIIVITGGDNFPGQVKADGTPEKTFKEWCHGQGIVFGNLIKECSPRVILFNNLSKSEEGKTRQRNELLFHAGQLQKEKGLYTTKHFETYAQLRSTFIKDSKQTILEETIQKRIYLLSAELGQLSIDSSLEDVDTLDARITDVYTEIGEESRQEESMQQLIVSLKRLRTTTEELRRAILEKNLTAMKSNLVVMSQHQEELKKTRKIPWGRIAAWFGLGLASAAVIGGGIAAIVLSGGTLAPVVLSAGLSAGKVLLDVGKAILNKKFQ